MKYPKLYYCENNDSLYIYYPNRKVEFYCYGKPFRTGWVESAFTDRAGVLPKEHFEYLGTIK